MPADQAQGKPGPGIPHDSDDNPTQPGTYTEPADFDEEAAGEIDEDWADDYDVDTSIGENLHDQGTDEGPADTSAAGPGPWSKPTTAAPGQSARVHKGARGAEDTGAAQFEIPPHMGSLLSLPGVQRADFETIDPRKAWISAACMAKTDALPLGHLAPDAVEVLQELGFKGHVRATVYANEHDKRRNTPAFFCAFKIPAREGESAGVADEYAEAILDLRQEIEELRREKQESAETETNPAKLLRLALKRAREVEDEVDKAREELHERLGVTPEALAALEEQAGDDEEDGGTLEALLALGLAKGQEFAQSPTAKNLGKLLVSKLTRWLTGEDGAGDNPPVDTTAEDAA